jgi:hypothetical protein
MRPSFVLLALASLPVAGRAQAGGHPWRFGFEVTAPARLLTSGGSSVSLGIGEAIEAARVLGAKDQLRGVALVRLNFAPVEGKSGGATWNAGRAVVTDVSVRAERAVNARVDLFAGAGVSHWSGPASVAPFSGVSSILYAGELGAATTFGAGLWRGSLTVHITQVGPDDDRGMQSGGVFRVLLGVHRDY